MSKNVRNWKKGLSLNLLRVVYQLSVWKQVNIILLHASEATTMDGYERDVNKNGNPSSASELLNDLVC